jgi:methylglutaconyl-CoA hydratase
MESPVIVESYHRQGVVVVRMNRPEHHNALNKQLVVKLTETFEKIKSESGVRAVILTGNGRSFCAGADLQGVRATAQAGLETATDEGKSLFDLMTAVSSCPAPVIGRVDGWAIGGGMGLVACCDLVVATARAKFGFSEVRLGLIPAVITPFVLSRIQIADAKVLYLTGERFDASRALEIGLIDRIAADGELDEQVEIWVDQLLKGAPGALEAVKGLLREITHLGPEEYRERTSHLFASRVVSDEGRKGVEAFIEKRRADWDTNT